MLERALASTYLSKGDGYHGVSVKLQVTCSIGIASFVAFFPSD